MNRNIGRIAGTMLAVSAIVGYNAAIAVPVTNAVAASTTTELVVTGTNGVPGNASAVVLNVTAADAAAAGYATVWPCGEARPNASNLNYRPGGAVANAAIVRVGAGGKVCVFTETSTQLIVDINGWYTAGSSFVAGSPSRVLDTRAGGATVDGVAAGGGLRGAGATTELAVAGRGGVPGNASAVVLNVTAADAAAAGYATVWPCGEARPNASNLNYRPGGAVANAAIVRVGAGGKVCVFTETSTQLIVDINGWYPSTTADFQAITPARLIDTRSAAPSAVPVGAAFVEDFTGATGLENFDTGVYHRDTDTQGSANNSGSWTGDHDLACGAPETQRTITKAVRSDAFYLCKDHMMTSVGHVDSYSVAWFTPKQSFNGVRQVSWDVNVTDLMARQWWEVSVVPATYNSGVSTCRYCTAINWLEAAGLPAYPPGSVTVGDGPYGGGFNVHANNQDFNPAEFQGICGQFALDPEGCASKAIRRTFTLTDNGNGTMTLNAVGHTYTFKGSFPAGEVKVVFKDHNYTPDKDGTPVGHTWHWDNIIVV